MITKPIGLYVHIPFCKKKCNYCDFCSFDISTVKWRKQYIDSLIDEIRTYREKGITLDSIFFGGGTPSLLTAVEFRRIVEEIRKTFVITDDCEFTIEANPGTVNEDLLCSFVNLGVNRLSMGLQSIHNNELKKLGRIHNYDDFVHSYNLARRAGIDNINIDLMYGIPEQTMESFAKTLDAVAELSPEHISLYGLILEEGTPFFENQSSLSFPTEDSECDMYYYGADFLRRCGYLHYEISNYAKPNCQSRHNLKYWRCEEYIGVGISAHSYFEGKRFGNSKDILAYFSKSDIKDEAEDVSSIENKAYEYVMLRLRLSEGFSLSDYRSHFGCDFLSEREDVINTLCNLGFLKLSDGILSLTERGFYVSNTILNELL